VALRELATATAASGAGGWCRTFRFGTRSRDRRRVWNCPRDRSFALSIGRSGLIIPGVPAAVSEPADGFIAKVRCAGVSQRGLVLLFGELVQTLIYQRACGKKFDIVR
jgi:hypothetical protein